MIDPITLCWGFLMGGLGTYVGLDSLLRGEITISAAQEWHLLPCRKPSFLFYFLSCLFLISGTGLLSYSLYLWLA